MFWPSIRRLTRSNVTVDHLLAITLMLRTLLASSSPGEGNQYLQVVAAIITDMATGRVPIDLLQWGLEFDFLVASIRYMEAAIPTGNLLHQILAPSKLESTRSHCHNYANCIPTLATNTATILQHYSCIPMRYDIAFARVSNSSFDLQPCRHRLVQM